MVLSNSTVSDCILPLILRCSETAREAQGGGTFGREAHSATQAAGNQDGQGEGGAEEEDEEQVRSQV